MRLELAEMNRHFQRHHNSIGTEVLWFELDVADSTHGVYEEGPARVYRPGRVVPILSIVQQEDIERDSADGRQPTQVAHFVVSARTLAAAGLGSPAESPLHLNDVFLYQGRYFAITDYQIEGLVSADVMVSVQGTETFIDQEFVNDIFPPV